MIQQITERFSLVHDQKQATTYSDPRVAIEAARDFKEWDDRLDAFIGACGLVPPNRQTYAMVCWVGKGGGELCFWPMQKPNIPVQFFIVAGTIQDGQSKVGYLVDNMAQAKAA